MRMKIPSGKKLRILSRGTEITSIPMILDDDVQLSLSSSFSPLLGGSGSKFLNLLSGIAQSMDINDGIKRVVKTGQIKEFGFQIWERTDPISFTATISFFMGITDANNAKTEVYDPIMTLASLPLPTVDSDGFLIAPGPSLVDAIKGTSESEEPSLVGNALNWIQSGLDKLGLGNEFGLGQNVTIKRLSMEIGNYLRINPIIVKRAEPVFSLETDKEGWPIYGKVTLDIQSLFTATVETLTEGGQ